MRSVTDVTIGKPIFNEYGIRVPIRMIVTDDTNEEIRIPRLAEDYRDMYLTYRTMQKGTEAVRTVFADELLRDRNDFSASGYEKYRDAVEKFLTNTDFPSLANGWFEDPESLTIH